MIDSAPPQSQQAERALLGSIAVLPEMLDEVLPVVDAANFYIESHRTVFRAFKSLHDAGEPIDVVVVAKELEKRGQLEEVGGALFLIELMGEMPHGAHADYYAKLVRETADRRQLLLACSDGIRMSQDAEASVEETTGVIESRLHQILGRAAGRESVSIRETMQELLVNMDREDGDRLPTGFTDLDAMLSGGLSEGQLVIVAARPGMGKSAFAGNISLRMARAGSSMLFVSLEMSAAELAARFASTLSSVPCAAITARNLSSNQKSDLYNAGNSLTELRIQIDDAPQRTISQISALARMQKRRGGLDALVVDYLQLVAPTNGQLARDQQVSAMSRGLKCLAKDLQIPVICLAQLNRAIEMRENKRPRLSDLRESGAIEQDADIVMFLDRPSTYDTQADDRKASVILSKGPTGTVELSWNPLTMTFTDRNHGSAF